ncbi:helix-turn-helix transcriptional regulator [Oscillibacter sp.]|uniref:helix-turn-helix domain-containing protein n=1 Tax=Oscillibacter sp. TaxID=1945593 RepID=UPI00289760C2|nr:helix-turn-helix transcriptional regulator [Oscillibacter sp.]
MNISRSKLSLAMLNAGIDTSKQLAKISGISVNTISRINNGNAANVPTVRRLASALRCYPSDLIREEAN